MAVQAHLSWGRWVADCSNANCTNAMALDPGQTEFRCWVASGIGVCGTTDTVEWPENVSEVESAISSRAPAHQSWQPGDEL